jgi:VIT1/CCC1 family predicted Fe2+/Mn2+ transporter|tara:strand:- start:2516 stop:2884 length:369 start_codon:yes stop_codon:yes gene_type:complete
MGILSTILGSGDVISKGLGLIDSMHTSDTEMIEAKTAAKTNLLSAYAPFKVAQRYLALIFGFTFVGSYLMVLTLFFLGRDVTQVQALITSFKIDWIMLSIVGFYFGGGAFEGVMARKSEAKK